MQKNNILSQLFIVLLLAAMLVTSGCSSKQFKNDQALEVIPAQHKVEDIVRDDVDYNIKSAYDPWEGFNRKMYVFNYYFDRYVFLPVVGAYETVLPDIVQDGVSNFFKNIGELKNLTNSILQLKGKKVVHTTARFAINTTIGLAGLWDPATPMGLPRQNEDFGQTLGHYGVGPGPYLVLPILGPSSLRDTTGFIADTAVYSALLNDIDPFENAQDKDAIEAGIYLLQAVDERHQQPFRYYESGIPAEYDFIRFLYLKKRELDIMK